jgi:hypothetical protein
MGDFKILKTVGEPELGPDLSFKVIMSQTFSWDCPFKKNSADFPNCCLLPVVFTPNVDSDCATLCRIIPLLSLK